MDPTGKVTGSKPLLDLQSHEIQYKTIPFAGDTTSWDLDFHRSAIDEKMT